MKSIAELNFGYGDAANYLRSRAYGKMFSDIFVKDSKLDSLMRDDTFFDWRQRYRKDCICCFFD